MKPKVNAPSRENTLGFFLYEKKKLVLTQKLLKI